MVFDDWFCVRTVLHLFYLLASVVILFIYTIPPLHKHLLQYGARNSQSSDETLKRTTKSVRPTYELGFVQLARLRVPHDWFLHFYIVSTAMSIFWLQEIYRSGKWLGSIASREAPHEPSMTSTQLIVTWSLMSLQSFRRLYESLAFLRPSTASMWIGHYLVGIAFYLAINISVWIEALPIRLTHELWDTEQSLLSLKHVPYRLCFCSLIFLLASTVQHHTHVYLSKLEKYTLPVLYPFDQIISPHYTAECMIYFSLAVLAAPPGSVINRSLFSAMIFVCVNLGVSADITKSWMLQKFPDQSQEVERRWRMFPGLW